MVERLMPFLDGKSALALVKALPLALEVIQKKSLWIKLVEQECPYPEDPYEDAFVMNSGVEEVMTLAEILKLFEDPNPFLLDLLHIICERFRPDNILRGRKLIQVSCTCKQHTSHTVDPRGFFFLEAVEEVFGEYRADG